METEEHATNTFSREGRIHQVEYALKSISSAGSAVGVLFDTGVVLLGRRSDDELSLAQDEKIYRINDRTIGIVAGLYADSNVLMTYARIKAQDHLFRYNQEMSPRVVAKTICKVKQKFTQEGGMRPFGVSIMIAGYSHDNKYRLFGTDPSGALTEWKRHAFGENEKVLLAALDGASEEESDTTPTGNRPPFAPALTLALKALASTSEGTLTRSHSLVCTVMYYDGSRHRIKDLTTEEIGEYMGTRRE